MGSIVLPRFYRQRFLLQFIEFAGGELSKLDLQKLLFLAHQRVNISYFDFVPFHYGCYSFQAASDLENLEKAGWIKTTKKEIELRQSANILNFVKNGERAEMRKFFAEYKKLRGRSLIEYVYKRFPYYTINSKIANQIIDKPFIEKSLGDGKTLYTIGYEGISFEAYVNKLIKNGINVLCDVRKNPLSRKFGFSKGAMSKILPKIDINYMHIPELGINSNQRKQLRVPSDYTKLFKEYSKSLPSKMAHIFEIKKLVVENNHVALTCFEQDAKFCHRSYIGSYVEKNYYLNVVHL